MKVLEEYVKKAMKECEPVNEENLGMNASEAQMWVFLERMPIKELDFIIKAVNNSKKIIKTKKNGWGGFNEVIQELSVIQKTAASLEKELMNYRRRS